MPLLLPPAKRDVAKAYDWYEEQRTGLGEEFLARLEQCLTAIARSPNAFQPVAKGARRAVLKQFPYVVFCKVEGKRVYVYSVFHAVQDPQKWLNRLEDEG